MRRLVSSTLLLGLGLVISIAALAGPELLKVRPGIFDPDHTGIISAAWVAKQGLPDAGGSNHALYLAKLGSTATNAAAFAVIDGVEGITLTELGFDYRTDGHCGAGAARFNVTASDGFHFMGGCANGTVTGSPAPGWNRVRIDPSNPAQAFPVLTPGATIKSIAILFDEATDTGPDFTGFVYLDNIDVNGTLVGKPGNAK